MAVLHFYRKKPAPASHVPAGGIPAIRCSICTGEQVAGFLDKSSGSFHEVMLVRNSADLVAFRSEYAIPDGEIRKIY